MIQNCEVLDQTDALIILTGTVFMPEGIIYGYEGWYGMDLIGESKIKVLFAVGTGPNMMLDLPNDFKPQDLRIEDMDGKTILQGHKIQVTGQVKYRSDNPDRECEFFVDQAKSLMLDSVLEPMDVEIGVKLVLPGCLN